MKPIWGREMNVLFLCTCNSARSIIAEAILNREGAGHFKAFSAGSRPKGTIHPAALDVLRMMDHPVENLRSKSWDEFTGPDAPKLDFVFTVCDDAANEVAPVWPADPMSAHWSVPDTDALTGSDAVIHAGFDDIYRMLVNRINLFTLLPYNSLDRLSLQHHLDAIGTNQGHLAESTNA